MALTRLPEFTREPTSRDRANRATMAPRTPLAAQRERRWKDMERTLMHTVVGLAIGAVAALLLLLSGMTLMLSVVLGLCSLDAAWSIGGISGLCFRVSPFIGLVGFVVGVVGSVIVSRVRQGAPGTPEQV